MSCRAHLFVVEAGGTETVAEAGRAGGRGTGPDVSLPLIEIVMPLSGVFRGVFMHVSYFLGGRGGGGADGFPPPGDGLDGFDGMLIIQRLH